MLYIYTNNQELGVDYLIICNELDKKYDLSKLIYDIRRNRKKYSNIEIQEFNELNIFKVEGLANILKYINESNLTVYEATNELGLDGETTNVIRIICSKLYFQRGYPDKGLEFIQSVEQSDIKNEQINKMLNDIRSNKNLFESRNDGNASLPFSLKLKP